MIRTLAILCLVAAPAFGLGLFGVFEGALTGWSKGLRVRFELTILGYGKSAFMDMPQSNSTTSELKWVNKKRPAGPAGLEKLELWCSPTDYTVCVFLDDTGYIAGLQVALDESLISDPVYDWATQGFTYWTTDMDGATKNYWTIQQYYLSANDLAIDAATRISKRDSKKLLQFDNIWVSGFNGKLMAISTDVTKLKSGDTDFTKQACIPWMGNHYYYKMSEQTECKADTLSPWFPLEYSNQLIGIGMVSMTKYNLPSGAKNWFEGPDRSNVELIVPKGPKCLYELADNPGLVTMHTYFIDSPNGVTCIF